MEKSTDPQTLGPQTKPPMKERAFVWMQYALPHHSLSWIMHRVARTRWHPLKTFMIEQVMQRFAIDMSEANPPDQAAYASFNDFFTRALIPGARPVDKRPNVIVSPCDGTLTQIGQIHNGRMLQAKGKDFSLLELIGGDPEWTQALDGGLFANIYLSPRDYHRVHMPRDGTLQRTVHIPGRLFSVNATTNRQIPRLFTRNERVACLFETDAGPMAVVMVGAIFVASIETRWSGSTGRPRRVDVFDYGPPGISVSLRQGEEMGRFNMGSTVLVLFGPGRTRWSTKIKPGAQVRMGQRIGVVEQAKQVT